MANKSTNPSATASGAGGFVAATCLDNQAINYIIAPQPTTVRGAGIHVGKHPRQPKIIYPSGKYVIVRDLQDSKDVFMYRGHHSAVSIAKFSPNGFWVASGDASGKVRIWSWDNPEHILKLETQVFNGEVKDLDWDPESKRIIAVGEGRENNAKVFMWDTGNTVGEINGHGKRVLSTAYRPGRPFRIMTASEDTRTVFYTGPPFVMDHSNTEHNNWVNTVRYSPDGKTIVSVGSDKKIVLYDGQTGHATAEFPDAHAGSIYSVALSPDGTKFATASADKTVKVWDLATKTVVATFAFDDAQLGDMQNAVQWIGSTLISLSLNGDINLLNPADSSAPRRTLHGHQVTVTAMAISPATNAFYTASYDGAVMAWTKEGVATRFGGSVPRSINLANHNGKITGAVVSGGKLKTIGFDDKLRFADLEQVTYNDPEIDLPGQPVSIATGSPDSDLVVIVHRPAGVVAYRGTEKVAEASLLFTPSAVAALGEDEIAIGGEDNKVHIYDLASSMTPGPVIEGPRGQISAISYSPSGDLLAVGDSNREVSVFERGSWNVRIQGEWVHHTSRITSLAWNSTGQLLASGSSDNHVIVWSVENPKQRTQFDLAHKDGVTAVGWLSDTELVTAGNDAAIVQWDVSKARK